MNRKNNNVIQFTDAVYGQGFMIVLAPSHAEFRKIVKEKLNIQIEDSTANGQFSVLPSPHKHQALAVIWSSDKQSSLVHEALHACSWVLRSRNICLTSEDAEEAYCYYLSYIWRTIKEKIRLAN